jgi:hypothetical protein
MFSGALEISEKYQDILICSILEIAPEVGLVALSEHRKITAWPEYAPVSAAIVTRQYAQ